MNRDRLGVPQSEDAEKGLLGSMLLRPTLIDDYADLPADALMHPARVRIFEMLKEMSAKNAPVDQITVTQRLADAGWLDEVGGAFAITELYTFIPSPSMHRDYARIVREKWLRRRIKKLAQALETLSDEEAEDEEDLISQSEGLVLALRMQTQLSQAEAVQHCAPAAMAAVDHIEDVYNHRGQVVGVATGIHDWDRQTGGLQGGDMIVIGARPSHGKTALGMGVAEHNAVVCGKPTLVFSVEMPAKQLMLRLILGDSKVNLQRVRDGFLEKKDLPNIGRSLTKISGAPLYIDDTPGLSVAQFRSRSRMAKMRYKIELIVVDYLQIMRGTSKRAQENRQIEISEISAGIKAVAKELNVPVIALAQLGRGAEEHAGPPRLSDLRESGSIEQDADQVLLVHRLDKAKRRKGEDDAEVLRDENGNEYNALLCLEKQRNGPTKEIKTRFVKEYTRFENVTEALYSNNQEKRQA